MTEAEIAYLAGIIDGEGCIMLQRSMARSSGAYVYPVVKIANTDTALIAWLREKIGLGSYEYRSRLHLGCKNVHNIVIASNKAIGMLELVRPFLNVKAKQADVVLALWAENEAAVALTGKKTFGRGNEVPTWLRHFRDALYWYVRDLNRRGPGKVRYGRSVLLLHEYRNIRL
jgi:hypothetical protein